MKKLFTLIALAMSFMGGYAQTTLIDFEGGVKEGISFVDTKCSESTVKIHKNQDEVACIKLSGNGKVQNGSVVGSIKLEVKNGFKKGDVISIGGACNNKKDIDAGAVLFVLSDLNEEDDLFTTANFVNGQTSTDDVNIDNYALPKDVDVVYLRRNQGVSTYITTLKVVRPASTESLTTAASSFSTYAASYPVDYKSLGLTAYAIGLDEAAKKVTYTEIDGIVPANTPVLVKGEASKTYSLTKATGDAAEVTTSLQVSDGKVVTEGDRYYAFATVDGKSGFKKLANGITIPAKKGYLKLATANAKGFFAFDDETTGIKGIENGSIEEEETPLYNLAGQRVSKDYKGVIVKNGKKFFNK